MLTEIQIAGFKSFARKTSIKIDSPVVAIVGPNGSGKSNIIEAIKFALGEQSIKSIRGAKAADLIWHGSKMLPKTNRASVSLVFDNKEKVFDIDFEKLIIQRIVFADGTSEYYINGSKVRLKDVVGLLASGGVGISKHTIISQGETDKIVLASPRQRFDILEEALGLKVYQIKKAESLQKLEKTESYITRVKLAQSELKPRLEFLKRQVVKLEKLNNLKSDLYNLLSEFIQKKQAKIIKLKQNLEDKKEYEEKLQILQSKKQKLQLDLQNTKKQSQKPNTQDDYINQQITQLEKQKEALFTNIGQLQAKLDEYRQGEVKVSLSQVMSFLKNITLEAKSALSSFDIERIRSTLEHLTKEIDAFLHKFSQEDEQKKQDELLKQINKIKSQLQIIDEDISKLQAKKMQSISSENAFELSVSKTKLQIAEIDKEILFVQNKLKDFETVQQIIKQSTEQIENQIKEAIVLLGTKARTLLSEKADKEFKDTQEEINLYRSIEKIKLQIEQIGKIDEEVIKEYETVKSRYDFYEKELQDLQDSIKSLKNILKDIDAKIKSEFKQGMEKINSQFNAFLNILFNGGSGEMRIIKLEDAINQEDMHEGVDIQVKLPKKRITKLEMLSGGEKSLVAIAAIFAMSQVSPPPFLVLDETDAALDELNAARFADMLKLLSRKTQIITITHNRETMVAADKIFGVTMGQDGASKMITVSFNEAENIIKN